MPPFRNPIFESGDGDPPEWTPPDYASPIKSDSEDKWSPPDYAKAVSEDEPKKPSVFSRIKEALSPAKTIYDTGDSAVSRFVQGVAAVPESIYKTVNEIGKTGASQIRQGDVKGALKTVFSPLMGPIDTVNKMLEDKATGKDVQLPSSAQSKEEGISQVLGVAGLDGKQVIDAYKNKDYAKLAGMGLTAAAIAGLAHFVGSEDVETSETTKESSIKQPQSVEKLYRMGGSVQPPEEAPIDIKSEEPLKPEIKQPFVNPFEKKSAEAENIQRNAPYGEGAIMPSEAKPTELKDEEIKDTGNIFKLDKIPPPSAEFTPVGEESSYNDMFPNKTPNAEDELFKLARERFNMGKDLPEEKPTAEAAFDWPEIGKQYHIKGGEYDKSTVGEARLKELGIDVPEWKPPDYAKPTSKELPVKADETGTPESLHPDLTGLKNHGDGILYLDFSRNKSITPENVQSLFPDKNVEVTELPSKFTDNRFRVDIKGKDPTDSVNQANDIEKSVGGSFSKITELHGGLGGIKPSTRELEPNKGPYGAALDKLFNSMGNMQEKRVEQDKINRIERARRFAAFSDVKEVGVSGASQSLSKLKGQFEKVDLDKLKMTQPQVDSLFTAVKRANITPGEKARGYTTLFKIFNGELPQRNELRVLDDVFGNNFSSKIIEMHGGLGAVGLNISKLANTMKSMQNAISLAAPLRHGIGLVARKEFYPAFADMFKFFANKEYYDESMKAIEERPNYMLGRESGLFIAKPDSLQNSEEEFLNSYIGQIPLARNVVGASQRAYTGFLNKLRSDTFDSMVKQAKSLGFQDASRVGDEIIPSKETKAISNFINNATGRGSLGSLNKMTNELNTLLWSPRMIASRITMLTNPKIYTDLPKGMRLDGLKSLLGIAALGTTIDTLAAYGGAKVSTNILSTDFGKSRFGKDLIDPWGGFQQYIVAAARFLAGKTDSSAPTSRLQIAGRFLANKESPAAALAHTILTSKFTGKSDNPATAGNMTTQYGEKTSIQSQISKQFIPIFIQDLNDLIASEPDFSNNIGLDTAMAGASLAGMEQSYPEAKKSGKLQFRKLR